MKSSEKKTRDYVFIVLLGAISGSFLGEILGNSITALQFLKKIYSIGLSKPFFLDLKVMGITFGIDFNINIMSIVGMVLAIILYKKY